MRDYNIIQKDRTNFWKSATVQKSIWVTPTRNMTTLKARRASFLLGPMISLPVIWIRNDRERERERFITTQLHDVPYYSEIFRGVQFSWFLQIIDKLWNKYGSTVYNGDDYMHPWKLNCATFEDWLSVKIGPCEINIIDTILVTHILWEDGVDTRHERNKPNKKQALWKQNNSFKNCTPEYRYLS